MTGIIDVREEVIGVRAKPTVLRRRTSVVSRWWLTAVMILMACVVMTLGYDYYFGRLAILAPQPEIVESTEGRVIKVPPGGNVQAAIESAKGGDIVELQAGAVYSGQINLYNRPITDFVTIRSSRVDDLPAGKRVGPAQKSSMATIVSGMLGRAAISAANGAHHYRFVGIEFTASNSIYNYGILRLGSGETRPENVPHHIEIDRSYIHPHKTGTTRRGIALNSADTVISNSYIEGFAFPGEETQGICGWTGSRNIRIINNYIEGGAENIMFGGADPANAELIPSDIEILGNHLNKPKAWKGKATLKTLFELKNAKRVTFTGNLLTNNWVGSAFRITIRNQDGGAPFSTIEDVLIGNNIISGFGEGVNILGRDDTYNSQTLKRLTIENNLFLTPDGDSYDGSGYFLQIADGEEVKVVNNTVFNPGNIVTFYGTIPRGFVFRDNIVGHGTYGIHGLSDVKSETARQMFQNNVFFNNKGVESNDTSFPPGNFWVLNQSSVGFADLDHIDLRLSADSKFKGKGSHRGDIGCDPSLLSKEDLRSISN